MKKSGVRKKPVSDLNERQVELVLTALLDRNFVAVEFDRSGNKRYRITKSGVDYMRGLLFGREERDKLNGPKSRK